MALATSNDTGTGPSSLFIFAASFAALSAIAVAVASLDRLRVTNPVAELEQKVATVENGYFTYSFTFYRQIACQLSITTVFVQIHIKTKLLDKPN